MPELGTPGTVGAAGGQLPAATRHQNVLCRRLVQERLYTSASVLLSPRSASANGGYSELTELTGLRTLITGLAGHIAAEEARG